MRKRPDPDGTRVPHRRALLRAAPALLAAGALPGAARAQEWPTRPIRLILPLAAGGGADIVGRALAEKLTPVLGQPMVVENRTGAGGNIATEFVARSAPDGHTLLLNTNSHNVNPLIYRRAGYEPLADFAPVSQLVEGPSVLVTHAGTPFRTLKDLVEAARARPGTLSYGSSGIGLPVHIAMELFKQSAKLDIVHVPYKGAGQSIQDVAAGAIPLVMSSVSAAKPHLDSGRIRALAVTAARRWDTIPTVPTMGESGYPDVVHLFWLGIMAPAGTPAPIVERLNRHITAVLAERDMNERFATIGVVRVGGTAEQFGEMLKADAAVSRRIVEALSLKAD